MLPTSEIQIPPDLIPPRTDARAAALATLFYRVSYRSVIQALLDTGLVVVSRPGAPPPAPMPTAPPPMHAPPAARPPIDPAMLQALTGKMGVGGDVGQQAKQQLLDQVWGTLPAHCQQIVQQAIAAKRSGADPLAAVGGAFSGEAAQIVQQLTMQAHPADPISAALARFGTGDTRAPRIP